MIFSPFLWRSLYNESSNSRTYQGLEGTGATVNYSFSDAISRRLALRGQASAWRGAIALSVGYLAPRASEPLEGAGLFNGS